MINAFAKAQRWTEPLKLLDDAIQKKMQANAIVFSSSIAAGAKSGRWQTALSLLLRMGQLEVGANPLTLSSAISCCSSTTEWCQALRCLPCTRRMRACSSDNAATMRGIEGSYNAALGALGADQWLQSLWLFQLMASKRVGDSASLTSVIDSVGKAGWWSAALDLLEVGSQGQSDAIMFSAAINACEKCACWQLALGLLARMGPRSCAACNAAISACSKATAWALMELRRDTISCNSLLNACDKSQQWMLSLHVLETMRTEGIQQDAITFTAVLGACETSDQWAVTMHLLQEVLDGGYCDWQADDIDYVHYFQAGSPYDCLKHMLILHTLTSMVNDASPFLYVDTHAGTGIYDLKSPEAQRFQNHQGGILSLMKVERHAASKALSDYLRLHGIFPRLCRKGSTFEETYLGSPAIAQLFLRPQDAAILFDASPQVASALDRNLQSLSGTSNTEVFCTSSYKWFSKSIKSQYQRYAHLSRVLALIDPPYDSASSSDKWNLFLVKRIRTMWPQSCVLLWYPFVSEGQTKRLDQRLVAMEIGTVLVADLAVSPKNDAPSESRRGPADPAGCVTPCRCQVG
ncbi:Ribosomal RNA large subunit methyltransferase J (23S rRNA (adenine(2030)-N6)-methyltransferase) (23S rRNA m6A2030 methyltransferase) (ORFJ) [Durusdinium trenchii]|uniref:Ribosomal RNA large subunit methyltransferase J (23S rRNA (Adenine(2030)-N6)-methyltransferase) (23S rRNA m6A2030 methyltransferase) (ORFJ) n=1 Tax=Durusdinium trenchii TaxID=1381693 RepID=A0ABP0KHZ9_9DINO